VTVSVVDYARQDQTHLLPLWGGLPDPARAKMLIHRTLLDANRYWRPYGLPNCSALDPAYQPDNRNGSGGVWMIWNTMLGEGLVEYGYRAEAAELLTRLMTAMTHALRTEKAFREAYNADKLEGLGDRDYVWGVAPVHLFMHTVGVRIISSRRVFVEGRNPFPWPVTIRSKGVTVAKGPDSATVTFPSGKQHTVTEPGPQFVEDA
jgi:glycogen debranching enzyme